MLSTDSLSVTSENEDRTRLATLKESTKGLWGLDADKMLYRTLESLRDRFNARYTKLRSDVASLEQDAQSTSIELQNALTSLLLLSHQQFVQNRVATEYEDAEDDEISGALRGMSRKGQQQRQQRQQAFGFSEDIGDKSGVNASREVADVVSLCGAVQKCRIVPVPMQRDESGSEEEYDDGDGGEEGEAENALIGGPYHQRRQMGLIGTASFLSDPYGDYYVNRKGEQELPSDVNESDEDGESDDDSRGEPSPRASAQHRTEVNEAASNALPSGPFARVRAVTAAAAAGIPPPPPPAAPVSGAGKASAPLQSAAPEQERRGLTSALQEKPVARAAVSSSEPSKAATASNAASAASHCVQEREKVSDAPTIPAAAAPGKRAVLEHAKSSSDSEKGKKPKAKPKRALLKRKPLAKRAGRGIFDSTSSSDDNRNEGPQSESSSLSSSSSSNTGSVTTTGSSLPPSTTSASSTKDDRKKSEAPRKVPAKATPSSTPPPPPAPADRAEARIPEAPKAPVGKVTNNDEGRKALATPFSSSLPPPPPLPPTKTLTAKEPAAASAPSPRPPPPPPPPRPQPPSEPHQPEPRTDERPQADDDFGDYAFTALPPPPSVDFFAAPTPALSQVTAPVSLPSPPPAPSSQPLQNPPPQRETATLTLGSSGDDDDGPLPPPPQVVLPPPGRGVLSTSSDSDEE